MATLTAGETFRLSLAARDAASIACKFGGASSHTVAAVKAGDLTTFDMASGQYAEVWNVAADTTGWAVGEYAFEAWVTQTSGEKHVIGRGTFTLAASAVDLPAGTDTRTKARRIVDNIEAMMEGNASSGVKKYKINNRELERYSTVELLGLLKYWRQRLKVEERKAAGIYALGPRIQVRF